MSKSTIHAADFAAPEAGVDNPPSGLTKADAPPATVYDFTSHTTSPPVAGSSANISISTVCIAPDKDNVVFLSKPNQACPGPVQIVDPKVINADCDALSAMALRNKYKGEANTHRCMLSRIKSHGAKVHPSFQEFRSFLRIVGAMPAKGATLDRINHADPEYAPGKVRWADKFTQNNNKSDNLTFYDPVTGKVFTAKVLAAKQGVPPDTIRKRRQRGWTDQEIINGSREQAPLKKLPSIHSHGPTFMTPEELLTKWEQEKKVAQRRRRDDQVRQLVLWRERYEARAAVHRKHRRDNPDAYEALLADADTLNMEMYGSDCGLPITDELWLEMFREDWPNERLHVIFERCSPLHQAAIEKIDPEYVRKHRAALAEQQKLAGVAC